MFCVSALITAQDCKICVTEEPGYMCKVSVKAKLDCPPKQVYDLLVDPDNSRFFSCIRAITYRKVIGTCICCPGTLVQLLNVTFKLP